MGKSIRQQRIRARLQWWMCLVLAASATGCVADQAQADRRNPANAEATYYHAQVGSSDSDIQRAPVGKPPNWTEP
jgi:hypothetical protein